MLKAGYKEASIYRKSGLSEVEKKKLILADNKTYSLGADDFENIEVYLEEITATGDFDVAGFDEDVLKSLMRQADEVLQDVQNYGVLSPEIVEQKKEAQQPVYETPADNTENATEKPFEPSGYVDIGQESKTIICPNCGECIPLD